MAPYHSAARNAPRHVARLGVLRCSLTGAITLSALSAVCWAGARVAGGAPQTFAGVLSAAGGASLEALVSGLWLTLGLGALGGLLLASVYNALGVLEGR